MSILSGTLKEPGSLVSVQELQRLSCVTTRYTTGPAVFYTLGRLGMGFQPYATDERSLTETGLCIDVQHNALAFDGRIDNAQEIAIELGMRSYERSDSELVLGAFRKWGQHCFRRLTGDWALALWSAADEVLYLARDHAGTRTLYFHIGKGEALWATYLDTLLAGSRAFSISKSYVACYITGSPLRNLTPYESVHSVPPGHYVAVTKDSFTVRSHWSAAEIQETTLPCDADYEESFLSLFRQAVHRRTDSTGTALAELSGGMDSTSIVCISDDLRRSGRSDAPLLDTVSYFDDEETSLDERRYFSITEARRGKVGTHLEMAFSQRTFRSHDPAEGRYLVPGSDSLSTVREKQMAEALWWKGYRSLLSGIGGDELLGGVPDPNPELAAYIGRGNFGGLLKQSIAWSLVDRSPLFGVLLRSLSYVSELYQLPSRAVPLPPWLSPAYAEIALSALRAPTTHQPWKYSVQQLSNERTWWAIMETLPHLFPRILVRPEYRYPFLDKDLVNFLMAIPRAQLLRPNRRRSLMRRALVGIVPTEILERNAKAFQLQGVLRGLREASTSLESLFRRSHLAEAGCIQREAFQDALKQTCDGDSSQMRAVLRVIAMELWLQSENTVPGGTMRPLIPSLAAHEPRPSSSVDCTWRAGTSDGNFATQENHHALHETHH